MQNTHAVYRAYGDIDVVTLDALEKPQVTAGELLIQVVAAAVNHMDAYVRQGNFQDAINIVFPSSSGTCFAGIVRKIGHGVTGYKVGDEVLGHDPKHGAHATTVVVPATAVVHKPAKISWEVAGATYLAGVTALATMEALHLGADDAVVISAAAGGVGHIECQLAHLTGATVIGIAGADNHDYLRSIGVKPITYGDDVIAKIKAAAGDKKVTAFVDNYGNYDALMDELNIPTGRRRGTEDRRKLEIAYYTDDGKTTQTRVLLQDIVELMNAWSIQMLISGFYAFEHLPQAYQDLAAKHSRGKVVVGMRTVAKPDNYLLRKMRSVQEHRAELEEKQPQTV